MHLDIKAETCTGCRICVSYCSFHHEGAIWPSRSRITIAAQSDEGPFVPVVCRQCEDAPCAAACPADAIARDRRTGAWVVDADHCLGCGDCADACPYGGIALDEARGIALKCDLCGGSPECAAMCPTSAITVHVERQTSTRQA